MAKRRPSQKIKSQRKRAQGDSQQEKFLSLPSPILQLLLVLFLIVSTFVVFWPLENHEFINLDDGVYVYHNPQVKAGLALKGVIWAFTSLEMETGNWHPLTWLSHMLDCQLYGLNSGWHHLTSLLFHIANTLLLFWVLKRMTGRFWASSFVAALFALHPLHVESVAWVAERKDVLSTFFWMLTLWAYLRYVERPGLTRYLLTILFFVLGLLSKPMLVTLPFVLLLLDYWPLGRFAFGRGGVHSPNPKPSPGGNQGLFPLHLVLEKVPFFSLAAVSSVITFVAQQSAGAVQNLEWFPLEARIVNALVSYVTYMGKMVWPHPLAVYYPQPDMWPMWQVAGAGLLLVCGSILVVRAARKYPYLLVGWLWYLGTLVPVIGLVQVGSQAMADRYTYVPLIGLFIMIAWGIGDILAGWRYGKATLAISASLSLSMFMVVTSLQIQKWHDNVRLFTHTLKVTTGNYLIHNNLGVALSDQGKTQEAIAHYTEALRINPNFASGHYNLGNVLAWQGKTQEAIVYYTEALRIKPDDPEAHIKLASSLVKLGRTDEAIPHYTEALRIDPNYPAAHNNMGVILADQGKTQEAMAHYAEALRIEPHYAEAHNNLGNALARQGKTQEAMAHYTEALRIDPKYADAHNNLGNVLAGQEKTQEAIAHYTEALRIDPHHAEAHNNLGNALARQGKAQEAIAHYTEALRIEPDFAEAHFSLGLAYLMIGNRGPALEEYRILKRINPEMANDFAKKILK
jgi:tetratricopeptide (TPR) repeat protein